MSLVGGGWSRRGGGGSRFEQPPVVVDVGCNCRAPRLLISSLISSLKSLARGVVGKPKSSTHASSSSCWSSSTTTGFASSASITTAATTTFSSLDHHHPSWGPATRAANANANAVYEVDAAAEHATRQRRRRRQRGQRRRSTCGRAAAPAAALGEETVAVAVEVESAAPYEDFRESMVEMVTEKEMYAWEDLNALLQQFLALNSPRHHPLILTAFADLWAPRGGLFCPPSPCL
ncbi:unnamed protein product [Miscanthus lutarioriparius]|uniref:Transcription repressor n=1 Tax=Miscanthus lutarioriparius TaxID=422564 RepID=A0A811RY03_9POAL|nr:unnamed protein product [Miscanthus lutarioriparius]